MDILVYIDVKNTPVFVGTLWTHESRGQLSATFEYSRQWLASSEHFQLEPALSLGQGKYHSNGRLFGAISDSAPDRWGRVLIELNELREAKIDRRTPKALLESDYLLNVNDLSRQGALRFTLLHGAPFLKQYSTSHIPPLISLGKLLSISNKVINNEKLGPEIQDLIGPGSSLGGARPKASVWDNNGVLSIAKFNSPKDKWDVELWEAIAMRMASRSGIPVPKFQTLSVLGENVLLMQRFDRESDHRIPYLSAMSMLGASDGEKGSYLDLSDVLMEYGSKPDQDLKDLWKRIVFNVLVSNFDDHLRNHGFLYEGLSGWRLSPLFDLEPTPTHVKDRFLSTNISEIDSTASLELAYDVAEFFGIRPNEARECAKQIADATKEWQSMAKQAGIGRHEIDLMSSAFNHDELANALKASSRPSSPPSP